MERLLLELKKMDSSILFLMRSGVKFSCFVNLIANIILLTYDFIYTSPMVYYIGISLFRTSLFFMVGFIICGFAFSKITKEL